MHVSIDRMTEPHISDPAEIILKDGEGSAETNLSIKQLCIRLLPGWSNLRVEDLDVTPISGGISNLLVKVSPHAQHGLGAVAFKVFGNKTELLIDRDEELELLLRLNACGFGAKVLAVFTNGRIEEFLTAKTLTPSEMGDPAFVPRIASTLRRLHAVPTDGKPTLWPTILRWYDMAKHLTFEDPEKRHLFEKVDLTSTKREIDEIRSICDRISSPVVFSHNDLLSGNILIVQPQQQSQPLPPAPGPPGQRQSQGETGQQERGGETQGQGEGQGQGQGEVQGEGEMQFIDYEYSSCGYRGFDFGNHFNEYAGFECDYTRYPSSQQQCLFFRHYLSSGETASPGPSSQELERLEAEANVFALASHIYWGVWALIQARYSPIEFDYLDYSATRWQEYYRRKDEFVAQAKRVLLGEK